MECDDIAPPSILISKLGENYGFVSNLDCYHFREELHRYKQHKIY